MGTACMWWRKALGTRWLTVDRLALVILLGAWWFVLQRDVRVVDTVDAASYLAAVYSTWRAVGAAFRSGRSVWVRARRSKVPEGGQDRCAAAELVGKTAQSMVEDGVSGRHDGGGRQRGEVW